MPEFADLRAFIGYLPKLAAAVEAAQQVGRAAAVEVVRLSVLATFGEANGGDTGPFPARADLTEATQLARARHGFSADEPELATGALMASVRGMVTDDGKAAVGVADAIVGSGGAGDAFRNIGDVAVAQEEGTGSLPPRSFLGVGGFRAAEDAAAAFVGPVVQAIKGTTGPNRLVEGGGADGDDRGV